MASRPLATVPLRPILDAETTDMSLIGRLVSKILGNSDRPVQRDERNESTSTPLGRLVTKILRR